MTYRKITEEYKPHLINLLKVIFDEVLSAGGDGDAIWYSRFYNINEIKYLIEEFNAKQKFPWEIKIEEQTIHWGIDQEWAIITNDENLYNNAPPWIQFKLKN
jgi:hypothetical protein